MLSILDKFKEGYSSKKKGKGKDKSRKSESEEAPVLVEPADEEPVSS